MPQPDATLQDLIKHSKHGHPESRFSRDVEVHLPTSQPAFHLLQEVKWIHVDSGRSRGCMASQCGGMRARPMSIAQMRVFVTFVRSNCN